MIILVYGLAGNNFIYINKMFCELNKHLLIRREIYMSETWNKAFDNFTWEDKPSDTTPLSASNLNKINSALNEVDNRAIELKNMIDAIGIVTSAETDMAVYFDDVELVTPALT